MVLLITLYNKQENLEEAQWDAVMNVNIKGLWQSCKAVVGPMREAGSGSIINMSSLAALYGLPYGLDYVASKSAVIGMTRSMARELGGDGIRVNAVACEVSNPITPTRSSRLKLQSRCWRSLCVRLLSSKLSVR